MKITINTNDMREVGDNLCAAEQDNLLILVIDTKEDLGPSSTGKMRCVAETGGFIPLPAGHEIHHSMAAREAI